MCILRYSRDPSVSKDEYIGILERRIQVQQEQLVRLRRRGQVLLSLLAELGHGPLPRNTGERGRLICLFEEDADL